MTLIEKRKRNAQYVRTYRHKHLAKSRQYQREYKKRNAEKVKVWKATDREKNKETIVERSKAWRSRNPQKMLEQRLRQRYGLTPEQYQSIIENQGGMCAICQQVLGNKLHIDHDHATGEVRGILCTKCNLDIGLFGDDPERLTRAVRYLRKDNSAGSILVCVGYEGYVLNA